MTRFRTLSLFLLLIAFTGCITIEENYTFKADGSGTMEYVVDMSELGEMMKAFENMGDKKGGKANDGMDGLDLKEEMAALKAIPGVKKVKVNDKDKFVQKLSFRFADINALNAALNVLMEDSIPNQYTFFAWEGNTLVRTNNGHAKQLGLGMGQENSTDTTDMTQMLEAMKYKYSFTFANEITSTSAAETMSKENPTTKQIKLGTDFAAISKDDHALDLRIELKR